MAKHLHIVAVSGGLQRPSRTLTLTRQLLDGIVDAQAARSDRTPTTQLIELGEWVPKFGNVLHRSRLPSDVESLLQAVEGADLLLVSSPIYRGSYTGLFKHFFDFVQQDALIDKPVLLAATGGSERHALAIDHQLRPLFAFFQAHTLPVGVYATDRDFVDCRVSSDALRDRIALAVERAGPALHRSSCRENDSVELSLA